MLQVSTAPHFYEKTNTKTIMRDVILALIPAGVVAIMFFGLSALITITTSVAGCVAFEYLTCRYLLKTTPTTGDFSAVITGILLAYNLPPNIPVWINLIGCFVAIVIAKMAFGGIGKNIFNPALVGRVFLFISFPIQMTTWVKPRIFDFLNTDITTSATTLNVLKHADVSTSATSLVENAPELPTYLQMLAGYTGGSLGEVSAAALVVGFIYLMFRRVVSWQIPFYYLSTFFMLTAAFWLRTDSISFEPITHLLSGGLMLGALFMATDYATSPMSKNGKIIFAVGCGILTFVIRIYSLYPEGVSFAILIMNALVPLIDKYAKPRIFGIGRK